MLLGSFLCSFLYFAVGYAVNEKQFAFVGVGLVFVNNYKPAASFAAVGVVACAVGLNELNSVNVHCERVLVVVTEECGDDIACFLPALKLGFHLVGRAALSAKLTEGVRFYQV